MAEISDQAGQILAPHESFGIHELLQLKNICALKSSGLTGSVADPKLRSILESDLNISQQQIKDLRNLIERSGYTPQTDS